ncbi:DUF4271 domain-containing protein [Flavobacterium sp.]|uniref:DUF4271 domain-containing protein n=1 Tax=Flavobacterium sp. TaxID=239 RepID=UPI0039E6AE02
MMDHVLHPRTLEPRDWATILFIVAFILVAIAKSFFETRFNEYLRLIVSDKYVKVYRDSSNLMSGFTIVLFVVQLLSLAFFVQLILSYFGYVQKTDWIVFTQILTFLMVFVLSKFLIEKIIATAFSIEEFTEQFNLQKVSYRTYIGLLLLPIDIILFYNDNPSKIIILLIIVIVLTINMLTYLVSLKNYQNFLLGKLFYFILYLCALEIAPYYFMYYWFTKS